MYTLWRLKKRDAVQERRCWGPTQWPVPAGEALHSASGTDGMDWVGYVSGMRSKGGASRQLPTTAEGPSVREQDLLETDGP